MNRKENHIDKTFEFNGKRYQTDDEGFLIDSSQWDEDFARGMATETGISGSLSDSHWSVIALIRNSLIVTGRCPKVYDICKACGLRILDLKHLFPTGYLRGACKLAGMSYTDWVVRSSSIVGRRLSCASPPLRQRVYRVDITGFLIDPSEWDEEYAVCKAEEMNMPHELADTHWKVIGFLRDRFEKDDEIPTVYDTCEANGITVEELEELFPDGYRRGAVKLAGLPSR